LFTLVTEFIAIRVGMGFFGIPAPLAVMLGVILVVVSTTGGRYWRWERAALGLAAFNLLFLLAAIVSRPDPSSIGHALATWQPLPGGSLTTILLLVVSNIGATVTPWMLFFQQSATVDKGMTPKDLTAGRIDVVLGGTLAALTGCAALVLAATLFTHHVPVASLQGGSGFGDALRKVTGYPVAAIFSLGLIEAGALAALTISASTAYAVGEAISGGHSFNRRFKDAPIFYGLLIGCVVVAAAVVLIPHAPLLAITLNANLFATALLPAGLVFLLLMANDRALMGNKANGRIMNLTAMVVIIGVAVAAASYAVVASYGAAFGGGG
ncbi:MAG: divalent metal cation transporter, partial [Candidatus Dormibacteraceae bacterium]